VLAGTAAVPAGTSIDDTAFNIATGAQTNVLELAEMVGKVMGQKPVIEMAPARPGELFRSSLDITKARKVLGWKPESGFADGLPQLVEWFRKEGR
jgi:UDP-glucose 4-epimerase